MQIPYVQPVKKNEQKQDVCDTPLHLEIKNSISLEAWCIFNKDYRQH